MGRGITMATRTCKYCGTLHTENKVKELVLSHGEKHGINPEKYGYLNE